MRRSDPSLAGSGAHGGSLFKQLVEFTAVKPHATTGRTVINFNPLSVRHGQKGVYAIWTFHRCSPFMVCMLTKKARFKSNR